MLSSKQTTERMVNLSFLLSEIRFARHENMAYRAGDPQICLTRSCGKSAG
jgi:hypothetical protein